MPVAGDGRPGALHAFTAMPADRTTMLGARRCPPVVTPMDNGAKSVTLFTSTGFASVTAPQYAAAVEALRPDVAVALADALHTSPRPSAKKLVKMVERTEQWLHELLQHFGGGSRLDELGISLFAPVLPVEHSAQWEYLRYLAEDAAGSLSGLAVYEAGLVPELARYGALARLPRLSLEGPTTPHDALRQVSLGVDLLAVPFVNSASDSGVALAFGFGGTPAAGGGDGPLPLGVDMWSPEHATSLRPLADGCACYACTRHHRAYLHHLLQAKEMLGWSLLQVHNHRVVSDFFAGVRRALAAGEEQFEEGRRHFLAAYEPELPEGTGERPRARGYHFKSEAGQAKRNKAGWTDLEGRLAPAPGPETMHRGG